mmetsp:Transcript_15166/g.35151  ORF Transcript_15166/g.35151 Transcript_15166/m.35151 type:complete len:399 (+) Transcript_15166:2-1198(+)
MAYRLKSIQYNNKCHHILLQNENGPCPLLAAANVLLLKKSIELPSKCIGSGVVTFEDLTNILGEKMLTNNQNSTVNDYHINEVMKIFPNLQFGMDVNPKFTAGPTGVEYTMELNAFDLLEIELVHGWLLDSNAQEYEWVGENTYNQLLNLVIEGNDATMKLERKSDVYDSKYDELSNQATRGTIIRSFLDRSSHQLTQHGLFVLHEYVKEGDMVVFFRNNHYNTLTKHKENLYLLVTDFGYADVNSVVWEKLDVIDGDTEYVTGEFEVPSAMVYHTSTVATKEKLVPEHAQSQADYHLALQLSRDTSKPSSNVTGVGIPDSKRNVKQIQSDFEMQNPPTIAIGVPISNMSQEERDRMLAIQLQRQEGKREERIREQQTNVKVYPRPKVAATDSECVIS